MQNPRLPIVLTMLPLLTITNYLTFHHLLHSHALAWLLSFSIRIMLPCRVSIPHKSWLLQRFQNMLPSVDRPRWSCHQIERAACIHTWTSSEIQTPTWYSIFAHSVYSTSDNEDTKTSHSLRKIPAISPYLQANVSNDCLLHETSSITWVPLLQFRHRLTVQSLRCWTFSFHWNHFLSQSTA